MSERGRGEDVATHIAEDIVVCWGDKKRAKTTLRKGVDYSSQKHVILMNGAMHLELISDTAGADDEADVELETIERRRVTIIKPDEDICTTMVSGTSCARSQAEINWRSTLWSTGQSR